MGQPLDRIDGLHRAAGSVRFTADRSHPGVAHAVIVHAEVARGRITAVDDAAARAVTDVIAVLTHLNTPPIVAGPTARSSEAAGVVAGSSVRYLGTDEVHWNGQPVAVVVADTVTAAREAARLVRLTCAPVAAVTGFDDRLEQWPPAGAEPAREPDQRVGDPEHALASAAVSVEARYTTAAHRHHALEPHCTTAWWEGDHLTVHDTTQDVELVRGLLALHFAVDPGSVRVVAPAVGGGFGGKATVWPGTVLAVLAARVTGRAVRLALSRESVGRVVGGRSPTVQRVALGARPDGTLTALVHLGVSQVGRTGGVPEAVARSTPSLYAAPHRLVGHRVVAADVLPPMFMRGPGSAMGSFARESAVDELARALDADPVQLRLHLAGGGDTHCAARLREALRRGARRFGWVSGRAGHRRREDGELVGQGVATAFHLPLRLTADVVLTVRADGAVLLRSGLHEIGVGATTAQAQITADALAVPAAAVRVVDGAGRPAGPAAAGSGQTAAVAAAVLRARDALVRAALDLARSCPTSPLRHAHPDEVHAVRGGLFRIDDDRRGESWSAILTRSGHDLVEVHSEPDPGDSPARAATGAQFCEVRVDPTSGVVRVTRWTGVFDVGRVVNPKLATSQLRGAVVMGLGATLLERAELDRRSGRVVNADLAGYRIPTHADVPAVAVEFLDRPDPHTPLGLIGLGEVGITGVGAAVANAVHDATGVRVRDLPIAPERILAGLPRHR